MVTICEASAAHIRTHRYSNALAQSHYAHITRRYHSEQCAKSARQLKADLAWLKKHRGEARQLEYLKDEILTRVVGFGWGEYKVSSSYESHSCFC